MQRIGFLCIVKSVDKHVHASVQPHVASEVKKHTVDPFMVGIYALATPLGIFVAIKVEHFHIACLHSVDQGQHRVAAPALYDP